MLCKVIHVLPCEATEIVNKNQTASILHFYQKMLSNVSKKATYRKIFPNSFFSKSWPAILYNVSNFGGWEEDFDNLLVNYFVQQFKGIMHRLWKCRENLNQRHKLYHRKWKLLMISALQSLVSLLIPKIE